MPNDDPWGNVAQNFAAARATIRAAQEAVLAEHKVQREIDELGGAVFTEQQADRFPALRRSVSKTGTTHAWVGGPS